MKSLVCAVFCAVVFLSLPASENSAKSPTYSVRLDTSPGRVKSPLKVDMPLVGTLRPRSTKEIRSSNWMIGCETLDRDFAKFDEYKEFLPPLGCKTIRLQCGWHKCEKVRGVYDFAWLDEPVDFALANGMSVIMETSYGNRLYPGGGGEDLSGGFPTSEEALAAWDRWVDALTRHFKGRVWDFKVWNEPDNMPLDGSKKKTMEEIAVFNVRTAKIIKRNIPDARIAALCLSCSEPGMMEDCLKVMGRDMELFTWILYHGYKKAPESSYHYVDKMWEVLRRYSPTLKLKQGENGAPSDFAPDFALNGFPWSEYSQAKWNMRRMLGDLGHDVESSVFTIVDYPHKGRFLNTKGLLRADEKRNVIAVKRAYYAVQNVVSVFDDRWTRVKDSKFGDGFGTEDMTLSTYHYVKDSGEPLFVFWTHGKEFVKVREKFIDNGLMMPLKGKYMPFERPGESFETRPAAFRWTGAALKDPVWVDLLTGAVYAFAKENLLRCHNGTYLVNVPVYDSPCFITERSALDIVAP